MAPRPAATAPTDAASFLVYSGGRRDLWQEVDAAYRWWTEAGHPPTGRFGLTVGPDGQHTWLDSLDNPVDSEPGS